MDSKRNKIIAVNFDGTLFENEWPSIGKPIKKNIDALKKECENGARLILWTNRCGTDLSNAIDACTKQGIYFAGINTNLNETIDKFGVDSRKIFADEYWDDKAVPKSAKDIEEFSDGFHTFNSLYDQRCYLFAALVHAYSNKAWKSWKHHDGKPCFDGKRFIVGINTPAGQYTYHYENKFWPLFKCKELETAPEWDGHTDEDIFRIMSLEPEYQIPRWVSVDERLPKRPRYDWVLTRCQWPNKLETVPYMAQLRKGVWYCDNCDGPMEETLDIKVVAWFDTDLILDPKHHEKSSIEKWGENEVELACKHEASETKEPNYYGVKCYESALKAFRSLLEDGHSGCSIDYTQGILNRLIEGRPLMPIEDADDVWEKVDDKKYQCKRMSSLFKYIAEDGTMSYSDVARIFCKDITTGSTYTMRFVTRIIDKMYPIAMPYFPTGKKIAVYCENFLTDRKNGDCDTMGVCWAILSTGERAYINRYFKNSESGWDEIDFYEFNKRKLMASNRELVEGNTEKAEKLSNGVIEASQSLTIEEITSLTISDLSHIIRVKNTGYNERKL